MKAHHVQGFLSLCYCLFLLAWPSALYGTSRVSGDFGHLLQNPSSGFKTTQHLEAAQELKSFLDNLCLKLVQKVEPKVTTNDGLEVPWVSLNSVSAPGELHSGA